MLGSQRVPVPPPAPSLHERAFPNGPLPPRGGSRTWRALPPVPGRAHSHPHTPPPSIDRRQLRRVEDHGWSRTGPAQAHHAFDHVVGLWTSRGWALVRTLSVCPSGVLLRLLDVLDPQTPDELRRRGQRALHGLSSIFGATNPEASAPKTSLLAHVGACLLARRAVHEASLYSKRPGEAACIIVPRNHRSVPVNVCGVLSPLNDPDPATLAVALDPPGRTRLCAAVEHGAAVVAGR